MEVAPTGSSKGDHELSGITELPERPEKPDLRFRDMPWRRNRSPINLPIRSNVSPQIPDSSPSRSSTFSNHHLSPRRSFYLDKAVPTAEELDNPDLFDQLPEIQEPDVTEELIFDDGDDRLPPPMPSPTSHANVEPDALAVSSPDLEKIEADNYFTNESDTQDFAEHDALDAQFGGPIEGVVVAESTDSDRLHSPNRDSSLAYREESVRRPQHLSNISIASTSIPEESNGSKSGINYQNSFLRRSMRLSRGSKREQDEDIKSHDASVSHPLELNPHATADNGLHSSLSPDLIRNGSLNLDGISLNFSRASSVAKSSVDGMRFDSDDEEVHESDVDSDRATIMSNDREDFERGVPLEQNEDKEKNQKKKKKGWLAGLFSKNKYHDLPVAKDEMGDKYDTAEEEAVKAQMTVLDDDIAFTRLDPETIQRHSQMFNMGGIHGGITPSRGSTSLIEELEIRKRGKRVQRQVLNREIVELERQRMEDSADPNRIAHPLDMIDKNKPTLLQMQRIADADYKSRVNWHTRTINRDYINEHGNETLAQRRMRLKAERESNKEKQSYECETLAQRRARLRRAKSQNSKQSSIKSLSTRTPSLEPSPSISSRPVSSVGSHIS